MPYSNFVILIPKKPSLAHRASNGQIMAHQNNLIQSAKNNLTIIFIVQEWEDITKRQNSLLLRVSCSRTHETVFNGE